MKLGIAGIGGRMGMTLVKAAGTIEGVTVVAGSERSDNDMSHLQMQLAADGAANILLTGDPDVLAKKCDAVIDFTTPESSLAMADAVSRQGGIHIIGTTGFTAAQLDKIKTFAKKARIVQSGNFSLGVNVLENLVAQAAKVLDDLYDIEISEMHHKFKKDAPSGTALMLARAAANGRGVKLEDKKVADRDGITGERKRGDIGFSVQRGGDVVGVHSIMFAGPGEVIELRHQGFSRDIYANGAIRASLWARKQKPGLYSMHDVLGL